jgi:endonuclease/exonuclease/phosphatase family metal-dependent hydrolase
MDAARTRRGRRVDLDGTLSTLRSLGADVIALQEVDRGQPRSGGCDQARVLGEALGMEWRYAPALVGTVGDPASWQLGVGGQADPDAPAYGVALLSRLPLDAVAAHRLPRDGAEEPRVALVARVGAGSPVSLVNTHLSTEMRSKVRQLRFVRRLLAAAPSPRVLAGDLNLRPRLVRTILGPAWRSALHEPTWSNEPGWPGLQLDYVLLHGSLGPCTPARVVDGPISNHRALVVDLECPASVGWVGTFSRAAAHRRSPGSTERNRRLEAGRTRPSRSATAAAAPSRLL